jgi:hypothetical protein
MQSLRNMATLALLILLALTVRVDFEGRSVDLDVAPDAEAATAETSAPQPWWSNIQELETSPAGNPTSGESAAGIARSVAAVALPRAGVRVEPLGEVEGRKLVWELDGKRVILFISADPPEAASPGSHKPCTDSIEPHLSC